MIRYDDFSVPIGYEVIKKDIIYSDIKTRKTRRKSSVTKNQLFQNLIAQSITNKVMFDYVLADSWFGSKANMVHIRCQPRKRGTSEAGSGRGYGPHSLA